MYLSSSLDGLGDCRLHNFVAIVVCGVMESVDGIYMVRNIEFTDAHRFMLSQLDWSSTVSAALIWKVLSCFTQIDSTGTLRWSLHADQEAIYTNVLKMAYPRSDIAGVKRMASHKLKFNRAASLKHAAWTVVLQLAYNPVLKRENIISAPAVEKPGRPTEGLAWR